MKLNKKQKRTATIASMAALLAVVLGMGGQTFAKYITTNTGAAQTATVAKWGYVINQNAENLFGRYYGDEITNNLVSVGTKQSTSVAGLTVGTNVVAPGTTGYMTITVQGKAEVKSYLSIVVANYKNNAFDSETSIQEIYYDRDANTETTNDIYYPVVWTLTDANDSDKVLKEGKLSEIETYLEGLSGNKAAGEEVKINYKLTWAWAFEIEDNLTTEDVKENEVKDTYDTMLGDLASLTAEDYNKKYGKGTYAADKEASSYEMSFAIAISVTQIQ